MSFFSAMASLTASSYEGTNEAVQPPTAGPTTSYTELERVDLKPKKRKAAESGSSLADPNIWDSPEEEKGLDENRLANLYNDTALRDDPAHGLKRNGSD